MNCAITTALISLCLICMAFQAESCQKKNDQGPAVRKVSPPSAPTPADESSPPLSQTKATSLPEGSWGGSHVGLSVTATGGEIEYDCAHGVIEQPIKLDEDGRFDVPGTFVPEGGSFNLRSEVGKREKSFAARYRGQLKGRKLILSVEVAQGTGGVDKLELFHGQPPGLEKCY